MVWGRRYATWWHFEAKPQTWEGNSLMKGVVWGTWDTVPWEGTHSLSSWADSPLSLLSSLFTFPGETSWGRLLDTSEFLLPPTGWTTLDKMLDLSVPQPLGHNGKHKTQCTGLPWWLSARDSACQCRRHGFDPWSRKIPLAVEQLIPFAITTESVL